MVKAAVVIDMSQEIRRGIYNILMDNSRKKSDCVTAMSFSIAIRRIQFQLLVLSWSIWLNTVLFSIEKVLTVLHLVEVTLDLNVELSEVTGKLLLKLFSNAYGNINTSLLIWFSNQCTERQTRGL